MPAFFISANAVLFMVGDCLHLSDFYDINNIDVLTR